MAWLGESAWSLLESSYEVGMVSLLVPLLGGLWWGASERTALAAMAVGTTVWLVHLALGLDLLVGTPVPLGLGATGLAALTFAVGRLLPGQRPAR